MAARMTMRTAISSQKMLSAVIPPARRHSKKISVAPAMKARMDQNFRKNVFKMVWGIVGGKVRKAKSDVIGWVIRTPKPGAMFACAAPAERVTHLHTVGAGKFVI